MDFSLIYQTTLTASWHARINSTNIISRLFLGSDSQPAICSLVEKRFWQLWKVISSWTATHIHLQCVSLQWMLTCLPCKRFTHILLGDVLKRVSWVTYTRKVSLHLQNSVPQIIHVWLSLLPWPLLSSGSNKLVQVKNIAQRLQFVFFSIVASLVDRLFS